MEEKEMYQNMYRSMMWFLPFLALWLVAPMWENRVIFTVCIVTAAVGMLACLGKDFYDERRTNPWRQRRRGHQNETSASPYERQMTEQDARGVRVKIAVLVLAALQIVAGGCSLLLTGRAQSIACAVSLLLPCCVYAMWLLHPSFTSFVESDGDFVNSGFGLLFGRERATLYLPLLCPPFLCVNWDILRYGAFTILALGRLGWMTLLTAAVIAALFFHSFLSGRRSGRSRLSAAIVATAAAASLIYGWLLVRGLNVYLDGEQGEILHAEVVYTHIPDCRYGANIHRDRFFTVELENGEQLDLFTPDDVHVEKNEGDDVTVALHKGALGIAWAEFV